VNDTIDIRLVGWLIKEKKIKMTKQKKKMKVVHAKKKNK